MVWNISLICFLGVFIIATILAVRGFTSLKNKNPIKDYILGGSELGTTSVISLLLSTSFGLNAIFLQIWLGYKTGIWSLIIQLAWCLSFILLAKYSSQIKQYKSLHDLLGKQSGATTRWVAGLFTLVGIMFLMGWEVSIGTSTVQSIYEVEGLNRSDYYAEILIIAIVGGCLLYTVLGGLKGNAIADKFLNIFKVFLFLSLAVVLYIYNKDTFWINMFPKWNTIIENMGVAGLISAIVFGIFWQFVDNSTWQNIIAGKEENEQTTKKTLKYSGILIFITPGIIGTIIGVSLAGFNDINDQNVLAKSFYYVSNYINIEHTVILATLFIVIISCIMSVLDGLFLSSSYTLVTDMLYPKNDIDDFENKEKAAKILFLLRFSLVIIAFLSIWGIGWIFKMFGGNVFEYVYLVVVTQLSLLGAVMLALLTPDRTTRIPMWLILIICFTVGFTFAIIGSKNPNYKWMNDGAGAITALFSVLFTFLLSTKKQAAKL